MKREVWPRVAVSIPVVAMLLGGAAACKVTPGPGPSPSPSAGAPSGSKPPSASPSPSSSPSSPAPDPSSSTPTTSGDLLPPETNYPIPNGALFVAPNGKASNSGTSADSPLTVPEAVGKAPAGGTIVFGDGTYRGIGGSGDVVINKRLTLQAHPNAKPLLLGTTLMTGWVREGSVWSLDARYRLTNEFPANLGCPTSNLNCFLDEDHPFANLRHMVFVNDQELEQVGSRAAVRAGTFFVDGAGKIFLGTDPGRGAEVATEERAFVVNSRGNGLVVRGLGCARYANMCLDIHASGVTLENNKFSWNAIYGSQLIGSNATVRGNTFAYNGMMGLRGSQMDNSLVENNLVIGNNRMNFAGQWSASGFKVLQADGLVVRNNRFERNNGAGLWCDMSCRETVFENNTTINNKGIGAFYEVSDRGEIKNNLVIGNGAGIMLNNTTRTEIHHNTVVDNEIGIYVGETARKNDKPAEIAQGNTWQAVDNSVHDNVMSGENNLLKVCSHKTGAIVSTVDRNVYHLTGERGSVASYHTTGRGCGSKFPTLAAFKAATGKEQSGLQMTTSPFVDAGKGNYQLRDAGLRNRGADLTR